MLQVRALQRELEDLRKLLRLKEAGAGPESEAPPPRDEIAAEATRHATSVAADLDDGAVAAAVAPSLDAKAPPAQDLEAVIREQEERIAKLQSLMFVGGVGSAGANESRQRITVDWTSDDRMAKTFSMAAKGRSRRHRETWCPSSSAQQPTSALASAASNQLQLPPRTRSHAAKGIAAADLGLSVLPSLSENRSTGHHALANFATDDCRGGEDGIPSGSESSADDSEDGASLDPDDDLVVTFRPKAKAASIERRQDLPRKGQKAPRLSLDTGVHDALKSRGVSAANSSPPLLCVSEDTPDSRCDVVDAHVGVNNAATLEAAQADSRCDVEELRRVAIDARSRISELEGILASYSASAEKALTDARCEGAMEANSAAAVVTEQLRSTIDALTAEMARVNADAATRLREAEARHAVEMQELSEAAASNESEAATTLASLRIENAALEARVAATADKAAAAATKDTATISALQIELQQARDAATIATAQLQAAQDAQASSADEQAAKIVQLTGALAQATADLAAGAAERERAHAEVVAYAQQVCLGRRLLCCFH